MVTTKCIDAKNMTSLPSMFFYQAERFQQEPFIWGKKNGEYTSISWSDTKSKIISLANNLISKFSVQPGDRIMIVSENRPEWFISDLAIKSIGALTVPTYTTNTAVNHLHIINNSGAKIAIVSSPELSKPLITAASEADHDLTIIEMDEFSEGIGKNINKANWNHLVNDKNTKLNYDLNKITREDACSIIYTSGTGGLPKGVVLSHGGVLCNCDGAMEVVEGLSINNEVFLSFLPLSHSYEHAAGMHFPVSLGAQIYYCERVDALINRMAEVSPTIMTAVPRLYETMREKIIHRLKSQSYIRKWLFNKTIELGRKEYEKLIPLNPLDLFINFLCTILVRKKILNTFGGRLKALVTGGAPLNYDVGVFFTALGIKILNGYGQTEASPVISANRPDNIRLHTVGPPLRGVSVKCANDGEILVKGELVMKGYWKDPDATISAINDDGWLHTGDIGYIDNQGSLIITDRKKDIIVNSGGDNISPQKIEGMICLNEEIDQAAVYGDDKPYLTAVIVTNPEWTKKWIEENKFDIENEDLYENKNFNSKISRALLKTNKELSVIEKIKKFIFASEPFTTVNAQLTPTFKIRRHAIIRTYRNELDKLYR